MEMMLISINLVLASTPYHTLLGHNLIRIKYFLIENASTIPPYLIKAGLNCRIMSGRN